MDLSMDRSPAIPSRADYVHVLADLLEALQNLPFDTGNEVRRPRRAQL